MNDFLNTPAETLCDRARRLAHEAQCAALARQANEQHAFLKTILGEYGLESIPYDEATKTYLICGWRWFIYQDHASGICMCVAQHAVNVHRGMRVGRYLSVHDLKDLGNALLSIDREIAYRDTFPATLWGAIRWWWAKNS